MKGLHHGKKIAVIGTLVMGILVLWRVEEDSQAKGKIVQPNTYPQITSEEKSSAEAKQEKAEQKPDETSKSQVQPYVEINNDVIGYISIPNTNVNYPVLMGQDNEYYLTHNIYKDKEKAASIMADYKYQDTDIRQSFQRHTLVYGHYLTEKTMFSSVAKYKNKEFFESHPYVYFSNLKQTGKWRVFSVYVLDADEETLGRKFDKDQDYIDYLQKIKERSRYPVEVTLDQDSKVLTLCTCSYETKNSRAIVHAVLVDE